MKALVDELETPVPIVDLDRLSFNLDRMAAYATLHGLTLRPHVKTHKSTRIAAEQLRLGAGGLTCATLREAEVMSEVCNDLLLAYPPVGSARLEHLFTLPASARVTVVADNTDSIGALSVAARVAEREIDVMVEANVGMNRTGVSTPSGAVELARKISDARNLNFKGLMFYPGHVREPVDEQTDSLDKLSQDLALFCDALRHDGLTPGVVSGGSTPAAWRMHEVRGVTEVRPGTYVYNDRTTASIGACDWDDCALTILATVVSVAVKNQVVIDAGTKALGREPLRARSDGVDEGFGALLERPEVVVSRMSEEHGILDVSGTDWRPRLGDVVRIVPNHVCISVHLFDEIVGIRGDAVETSWAVNARGRRAPRNREPSRPTRPRAV